jgi:hypothetical protein
MVALSIVQAVYPCSVTVGSLSTGISVTKRPAACAMTCCPGAT